ncbi:hypothetical protein Lal_00012349 [Lupinus albus]|nr:hypothetical protein Lal_00048621 [Lupinus albus]KAF1876993.1 hypothetical protein Lal_00015768 [Lupinus albus]KAF1876999.1 hypothetical protein Lal_00011434 [Lupinus albus]KAF1877117.1 hypothetical protein Lal_00012349 [Lupinus albus]
MDSEGSRRLTTNDALLYLKEIKTVFTEDMEKYEYFLKILIDFKENRIGRNDVIEAAKDLFKGHDHLLLGLNNFLPRGYEIQLPLVNEESSEPVLGIQDPTDFKNKFKARFEENSHVYESFLDIIKKLEAGEKSTTEAQEEIAALLEGHEDLLHELVHFLPGASGSAST